MRLSKEQIKQNRLTEYALRNKAICAACGCTFSDKLVGYRYVKRSSVKTDLCVECEKALD